MGGKVEFHLRGAPEDLKALRQRLDEAGLFVQVDREYERSDWVEETITVGALVVPAAERLERGADA